MGNLDRITLGDYNCLNNVSPSSVISGPSSPATFSRVDGNIFMACISFPEGEVTTTRKMSKDNLRYRDRFLRTVDDFLTQQGLYLTEVNFKYTLFTFYPIISGKVYREKQTRREAGLPAQEE
jgi:hypothetical protein